MFSSLKRKTLLCFRFTPAKVCGLTFKLHLDVHKNLKLHLRRVLNSLQF